MTLTPPNRADIQESARSVLLRLLDTEPLASHAREEHLRCIMLEVSTAWSEYRNTLIAFPVDDAALAVHWRNLEESIRMMTQVINSESSPEPGSNI